MNSKVKELIERYPTLTSCAEDIDKAIEKIIECYKNGGKVLLCGNGGSAADSTHIVGELMKGFLKRRPINSIIAAKLKANNPDISDEFLSNLQCGLPAVNLCESSALITAYCNDVDPNYIFAQQTFGLGKEGDILIGMSTSGNAENVNLAANIGKAIGMTVIGLTGQKGGKLFENAHICVRVPATETYKIQEYHLPVYHAICAAVEEEFFSE